MKLYVINPEKGEKIYLKFEAETRKELLQEIGNYTFYIDGIKYTVDDVMAEDNIIQTITGLTSGAIIGGAILGAVGVPVGALLGTGLAVFGAKELLGTHLSARERVRKFNEKKIKLEQNEIKQS